MKRENEETFKIRREARKFAREQARKFCNRNKQENKTTRKR
jgi:hypothetical protein